MIGIYAIQNKINGKIYVGQSIDIERRWKDEKRTKKVNIFFKRAIEKYGLENFFFYVLKECERKDLNYWEAFYVKLYHSFDSDFGYNLTSGGDHWYKVQFRHLTDEHKRKISESHKGKSWQTEEGKKRGAEKRHQKTLETHKKDIYCLETDKIYHSYEELIDELGLDINLVHKCLRGVGNRVTKNYHICFADQKDQIEWNLNPYKNNVGGTFYWKKDTIEKIREAAKGRVKSEEERKKLSIANKGKKLSEEHKRKISESQIGMKRKEGTGQNISEAKKLKFREKATRKILCIETGETFYTLTEATNVLRSRYPKINKKGISFNLKGKNQQTQGLHFRYTPVN